MRELEMKVEELEVVEEMMSDFEKGFWEGIGIVAGGATLVTIGVQVAGAVAAT